MSNDFNMCPMCGSKKILNKNNRKWFCSDCGFDLYCNIAAAVGVILKDKNGNILFEVRAKEPRKGCLALPGGFVDADEAAEDAIVRECQEELGIKIKNVKFLCTNPNDYLYKNIAYKTCDIFFTAEPDCQYESLDEVLKLLSAQKEEVTDVVSVLIKSAEDIDKLPIAFESTRKTLHKLFEE